MAGHRHRLWMCGLLLLGWLLAGQALAEAGKCFLWEVTSKQATVYLLGSVHMMRPQDYPLDACIDSAFARAGTLAVELDMPAQDADRMGALMLEKALYPPGESLESQLAPATLERLRNHLAARGIPIERVSGMRPWFLGLQLALQEAAARGYRADLGIDVQLLDRARGSKRILELENAQEQIDALAGDGPAVQDLALRAALEDLAHMDGYLEALIGLWRAGDAEGLYRMMMEPVARYPALESQMQRLLHDRNHAMTRKIVAMLQGSGVHLVVVGGGHMGGEQGILSLLARQDYRPRQLLALGVAR